MTVQYTARMHPVPVPATAQEPLVAYYRSGDAMRSRSVGPAVLAGRLAIPSPSQHLLAEWARESTHQLALEPGDVEPLRLPRARMRWPDYRLCVQAVADWTRSVGLQELLASGEQALMACRGARYHLDAERYGANAFCNLFVSDDKELDLHFPALGRRIPLERGTVVVFDTGQPHGVVDRRSAGFSPDDFPDGRDRTVVFLTWELPIEDLTLAQALGTRFDVDADTAARLTEAQVWQQGVRRELCPESGRWR
jgi:hypothetical protein